MGAVRQQDSLEVDVLVAALVADHRLGGGVDDKQDESEHGQKLLLGGKGARRGGSGLSGSNQVQVVLGAVTSAVLLAV